MALDSKVTEAVAAQAAAAEVEPVDEKDVGHSDAGKMVSEEYVALAKKLPEKDEVQKAVKAGMLAKNPKEEHKAKVRVVKASPNADETPSGQALIASEGIADDTKRAAAYRAVKSAVRHGYAIFTGKE